MPAFKINRFPVTARVIAAAVVISAFCFFACGSKHAAGKESAHSDTYLVFAPSFYPDTTLAEEGHGIFPSLANAGSAHPALFSARARVNQAAGYHAAFKDREFYYQVGVIFAFAALPILLAIIVISTIVRRRRLRYLDGMYKLEKKKRTTLEEYRTTFDSIGDAVITIDHEGRVNRMNPVAEMLTGWAEAEASGRPVEEIYNIICEETGKTFSGPTRLALIDGAASCLSGNAFLISRSGDALPIADSRFPLKDSSGAIFGAVLVFRDQTVEKEARKRLESAGRLYAFLSSINQAVVRKEELPDLFHEICRIAVEVGGFRLAWVGRLDEESGEVEPLTWHGQENGFLSRIKISIEEDGPYLANSGRAILEGSIATCDDVVDLDIALNIG